MKRNIVGILAAVAAIGFTQVAEAQICAGFPSSDRGFYFGGRFDTGSTLIPIDGVDALGVEAAYNAAGPLSVFGGLNVLSHDDEDDTLNQFRVGAAFELASLGAMIGPQVSACPTAEARWISDDGVTFMEIPVGLGIGADLGMPAGPSIGVYAQPQIVFFRFSGEGATITENDFGITGGAMVGFGQLTVGADVRHIFADDRDPVFGLRAGIRL